MIEENIKGYDIKTTHDLIEEARDTHVHAVADAEAREYAKGFHRQVADDERKAVLGDIDMRDTVQNLIKRSLNELSGRMKIRGYTCDNDAVAKWLEGFFVKNQIRRAGIAVAKRALIDGNAALSVSWRGGPDGRPVVHHEQWWDGDTGVFVAASDGGEVWWAVSEFYDRDGVKHRTLFTDDTIFKYQLGSTEGWLLLDEIPWRRANGKPLGVPFAYFPNGAPEDSPYGQSTVFEVMGAQDDLNASLFNRRAVSTLSGTPIYWAAGPGASDELIVEAGTVWTHPDVQAKFGVIPAANLDPMMKDTDDLRGIVSGAFPVPSYRVGEGEWPSGTALLRADGPMISAVLVLEDVHGPGHTHIAHRATELHNEFSSGPKLDETALIGLDWEEADQIDPGTQVEVDQARAAMLETVEGLTEASIRKLGIFDEDELAELLEDLKEREELLGAMVEEAGVGEGDNTGNADSREARSR